MITSRKTVCQRFLSFTRNKFYTRRHQSLQHTSIVITTTTRHHFTLSRVGAVSVLGINDPRVIVMNIRIVPRMSERMTRREVSVVWNSDVPLSENVIESGDASIAFVCLVIAGRRSRDVCASVIPVVVQSKFSHSHGNELDVRFDILSERRINNFVEVPSRVVTRLCVGETREVEVAATGEVEFAAGPFGVASHVVLDVAARSGVPISVGDEDLVGHGALSESGADDDVPTFGAGEFLRAEEVCEAAGEEVLNC